MSGIEFCPNGTVEKCQVLIRLRNSSWLKRFAIEMIMFMVRKRNRISRSLLPLVLLSFTLFFSCTTGPIVQDDILSETPVTLLKARDAWLVKDYETTIKILEPLSDYNKKSYVAEKCYLLGMAYFEKSSSELSQLSMNQRMFQASDNEAYYILDKALARFQDAIWYDVDGSFSVGSFYMSGRILDVGFLQRMDEAMEFYRRAFTEKPKSSFGRKALQRYRILAERAVTGGH